MSACSSVSGPGNVSTSPRPAGETSQTLALAGGMPRVTSRVPVRLNETLPTGLVWPRSVTASRSFPRVHLPGPRESVHAAGGDAPPVAAELDVEDRRSMGVHDVELLARRQSVQLELAAFRLTGDEHRAVGADIDVHDPGGTARILDHADLLARTRRRTPSPRRAKEGFPAATARPRCGRGRRTPAPRPRCTRTLVRSWTPGNARSCRPVRTSQTRTARSAPSVASRVPSALNRVAKTPPRWARRTSSGSPVAAFQSRTMPSTSPVATSLPVRAVPDREDCLPCARRALRASSRCARRGCSPSARGRLRRSGTRRARRRRHVRSPSYAPRRG